MGVLRYRTPVGLSSRLQQQHHAEPRRCFGVAPGSHRHRRSCRSTKTETITRAPTDDQQQQVQHNSSDSNGNHHQWEAQENLVNLITALPMPSPQEVLDRSTSPSETNPWEDVPEKAAETVRQTPGATPFQSFGEHWPSLHGSAVYSQETLIVCLGIMRMWFSEGIGQMQNRPAASVLGMSQRT